MKVHNKNAIKLSSMVIEDQWQDEKSGSVTTSSFGQQPEARWFVEYTITLSYTRNGLIRRLINGNNNLDFGYISLVVCSPALKDRPEEYVKKKINKALVQQKFDDVAAREYVESRLRAVSAGSKDELEERLGRFLSFS